MKHFFTFLFLFSSFSFSFHTQGQIEEEYEPWFDEPSEELKRALEELDRIEEELISSMQEKYPEMTREEILAKMAEEDAKALQSYDKTTTDSFSFICSTTAFSQANNDPPDEEFIQANLDARFMISVMRDLGEIMVRRFENGEEVSTNMYKIFHETEGIGIYAMAEMTGFWIEILAVDITKENRGATKTFQGTFFTNVWLMECR